MTTPRGPVQREIGADEDLGRAPRDEAVDELLGGHDVDLVGPPRGALEPVEARVVDVDVEPVLVRQVAEPAVAGAEVAAVGPREVADQHARGVGVRVVVRVQHELGGVDELARAPAAPTAVRRAA
jgi:hypothetical protein